MGDKVPHFCNTFLKSMLLTLIFSNSPEYQICVMRCRMEIDIRAEISVLEIEERYNNVDNSNEIMKYKELLNKLDY